MNEDDDFDFNYSKNEKKNKIMAGILAIFGGVIGMHKFYLNQTGIGLTYSLMSLICVIATGLMVQITQNKDFLFIAAIPYAIALYSIYEGILLIRMKDDIFDSKYNTN
ncbi:putative membrane protein [Taylorella equigenitalis 14/56]|uniref:TM2 domain-containing protein n=3 Tax=Taylorella equigenitalis TaxID=29575 RepID=A0A654KIH0_TAYEM|nr:TM2 domain-containing protein [Taylorella equigenitalis]ADU92124.1 hypothetical protein TEQUI_1202 [Taylorella equigenitalis MCE9]AFN35685.1 putative membrane protein [Taylorella equigenitalis ATCC 35865]ASY39105.1 TM2 domain-containing protein [Taylorella equigenitalis]ASY40624.1 hypothetical protein CAV20_02820 [Taylorella equigenitalis]ASY42059.1 hypothetical protein CA943_02825 [Taylorella equigenitalis]